ncbi:MAG: hypothetical protein H0T46_01650 [Deltaproteobacteria bacterium]|nr:hypothetical protein [Deltaproteobacteria bacterium]
MALLRLALVALAGCSPAGAQPSPASGITPPAGWQALPDLAKQVVDATKATGSEAWGETARGCYAVWFTLKGAGAKVDAVLAGLAAEKIATTNVVTPESDDGVIAASFTKGSYGGRLRARIAGDTITALACFANEREPKTCESPCTTLLGALP